MNVTCPKCSEAFPVVAEAVIPKTQVMHMKLTSESELFSADAVGKAMSNMTKVQVEVARELGVKVCVFLRSVVLTPHEIKIGFQIVQTQEPASRALRAA